MTLDASSASRIVSGDPLMKADGKRWMTPEEILERNELNIANTASALRRRVLQATSATNGSSPSK